MKPIPKIQFEKLSLIYPTVRSAYRVRRGRKILGFVFSKTGFSYLGSQGWNRGIRLKDFHPIDWGCCKKPSGIGQVPAHYSNRPIAASNLEN